MGHRFLTKGWFAEQLVKMKGKKEAARGWPEGMPREDAADIVFKRRGALWDLVKNRRGAYPKSGLTDAERRRVEVDFKVRVGREPLVHAMS